MANESDIPIFAGGIVPIGQINGVPVAHKKQASGLLKHIMAHAAKPAAKSKAKGKASGRRTKRGIEADSRVHFGTYPRYY
jgi:hypothetical protein